MDEYGFNKIWTSDGRIIVMEERSTNLKQYMDNS